MREKIENMTDEQLEAVQGLVDAEGEEGAFKTMGLPPSGFIGVDAKAKRYLETYKNLVRDAKPMNERGGEIADRQKIHDDSEKEVEIAEKDLGLRQ
jgi:hypothetical protein